MGQVGQDPFNPHKDEQSQANNGYGFSQSGVVLHQNIQLVNLKIFLVFFLMVKCKKTVNLNSAWLLDNA